MTDNRTYVKLHREIRDAIRCNVEIVAYGGDVQLDCIFEAADDIVKLIQPEIEALRKHAIDYLRLLIDDAVAEMGPPPPRWMTDHLKELEDE